jgi:penicillin-binding protein-related factor A (putative recombinase)
MKPWRAFEKRIRVDSQMLGITCIKVPNHLEKARSRTGTLIDVEKKTAFDFCAGIDGLAMFFDAKYVSAEDYLSLNEILKPKKYHQYSALVDAWAKGNIAGYIIYLYKLNKICWCPVTSIMQTIDEKRLKRINLQTPGLTHQEDDVPLDIRKLTWNQRAEIVSRIS